MNINSYSPETIIGACVAVFVVILLLAWGVRLQRNRRRTEALRARFGPEYDAALAHYGSRRKAEAALEDRLRRAERYEIRPLSDTERDRFLSQWDTVQARFVDFPRGAVTEADELISTLLHVRGYPGTTFEQRCADLSVHYPHLIDPCRRANAITARAGRNEASTEELRTAMICYRSLLDELIDSRRIVVRPAKAA